MTTFEDREHGFEAKFAHDEEFRFRVTARRDKLLAGRVADSLALAEADRASVTQAILALRDGPAHDALVAQHISGLLQAQGKEISVAEVAAWLQSCAIEAKRQLLQGPPT